MDHNFTIDLELLLRAFGLVAQELERRHGKKIELPDAYYWNIPSCSRYDPTESPCAQGEEALTIGQLSEDYAFLETTVNENEPVPRALAWLGNIMLRLAEM